MKVYALWETLTICSLRERSLSKMMPKFYAESVSVITCRFLRKEMEVLVHFVNNCSMFKPTFQFNFSFL